ncbi:MAG TPA: class I SAM-dependent methyltransferase [Ktedonobacteraceae bacterium]|nr:class I SAM-dependent methyltransferase [Ktedonobacteraceae bacterium]
MSSPESSPESHDYVVDAEDAVETMRLIEQDQLTTREIGGLFPEQFDLSQVRQVLDIGCGPGGWVTDFAFVHPHMDVVGIDISATMVKYAFATARARNLQNVSFEIMDARQPLAFPDAAFDFVNARFILGFMDQGTWPSLLREAFRILRPGGILCLTEPEIVLSNSAALNQLQSYLYQAFSRQGRTFAPDGRSYGITFLFNTLLREAGFVELGRKPFFLDASYGTTSYYPGTKNFETLFPMLKPFITHAGLADETAYEHAYQTLLIDMLRETYICVTYGLTAWGIKPAAS